MKHIDHLLYFYMNKTPSKKTQFSPEHKLAVQIQTLFYCCKHKLKFKISEIHKSHRTL